MTRIGLAIAGLGVAAALTACGGSDGSDGGSDGATGEDFTSQSGQEIADASKSAMEDLDAVKVSGDITTGGEQVSIDLQVNSAGDCEGSIGAKGGTAQILGSTGTLWFKPDEAFWTATAGDQAAQIMDLVGDKWVVIPSSDSGFDQFCDLDELLGQLLEDDSTSDATFTTGDTSEMDGNEVVAVDRESTEDGTSTGYILVDDPHYIVKIEKTAGPTDSPGDSGSVIFSAFDEEFDVAEPSSDDTIDLDNPTG